MRRRHCLVFAVHPASCQLPRLACAARRTQERPTGTFRKLESELVNFIYVDGRAGATLCGVARSNCWGHSLRCRSKCWSHFLRRRSNYWGHSLRRRIKCWSHSLRRRSQYACSRANKPATAHHALHTCARTCTCGTARSLPCGSARSQWRLPSGSVLAFGRVKLHRLRSGSAPAARRPCSHPRGPSSSTSTAPRSWRRCYTS
jgi:hypothetical protein